MRGRMGRRRFVGLAARAAAAAAVPGLLSPAVRAESGAAGDIPARVLGGTGVRVPVLGYGSAVLAKAWGGDFPFAERVATVRHAYDRGVRYFDTAGNYMEAQAILGEALEDVRARVHLVSRVETTSPPEVRREVGKTMKALRTGYLDAVQIHGTPGLEQMGVNQAMKVHAELVKLKAEGVVRHIGFSAHSYFDKALALIDSGGFDHCMLPNGYILRGHEQLFSRRMLDAHAACVARAHELGMGLVAMKVMAAGMLGSWSGQLVPGFDRERLERLPGAAIRHALDGGRFHVLVIGMRTKPEVDANIRVLEGDPAVTDADRDLLAAFSRKARAGDYMRKMRVD